MKFTLTIETDDIYDLQRIVDVVAAPTPKLVEPILGFPADQGVMEAPSAEPKLTRKEKKARNRVKGNGAEPEAAAEAAEAPEAEQNVPQLNVLKKVITDAVLAEKRAAKTTKLRDMVETLKEDTGLDFVMSAKDEHRDALYAFTQKAGLTVA